MASNSKNQTSTSSDEIILKKKIDDKALNEAVKVISKYLDNGN